MIKWTLTGLLALALMAPVAQAARISGLYTAQLLVAEQSIRVDPKLVGEALSQVVVKVSGRRDILSSPTLRAQMSDPSRFIQQFSYQSTTLPKVTADGREVLAHRLQIDFDSQLVDRMLADAGIRPLASTRPGVLVWIVEERRGVREYLGRDEDPVFEGMLTRARERGLPIFRPLMDFEDQQALPLGDAWAFFTDSIEQASSRYQADSVLVGRVYRSPQGGWNSQWLLRWQQDSYGFEGQGATLGEHLASSVDLTADHLFADFVATSTGFDEEGVQIRIEAVKTLDDYFSIMAYLREQTAVQELFLKGMDGEVLTLRAVVNGTVKQLQGMIGLDSRFKAQLDYQAESEERILTYRWGG